MAYISGYAFHKISKWSFCNRYPMKLDMTQIQENDLLFLNLNMFHPFLQILNRDPPNHKFVLITHNSDNSFTNEHFNAVAPYINKVYSINSTCVHPLSYTIPIGFRDKPIDTCSIIQKIDKYTEKNILVSMNFKCISYEFLMKFNGALFF